MESKRLVVLVGIIGFFKNSFLIVQRSRKCNFLPQEWTLPAGKINLGIENVEEAILRELKEETGLSGTVIDIVSVSEFIGNKDTILLHNIQLNYLVSLNSDEIELNEESENFDWCDLDNFSASLLNVYNKKIIEYSIEKIKQILNSLYTK